MNANMCSMLAREEDKERMKEYLKCIFEGEGLDSDERSRVRCDSAELTRSL